MAKGWTVGVEVQPLTVNTYRNTPMVFTVRIQTDWIVPPELFFPDYNVYWVAELVEDFPNAARWDVPDGQVDVIPDMAKVEMRWDNRVIARGVVRRKGW